MADELTERTAAPEVQPEPLAQGPVLLKVESEGPVPLPGIVRGYTEEQQAIIFAMAEREQAARHLDGSRRLALEAKALELSRVELELQGEEMRLRDGQDTADRKLAGRGQIFAMVISIVGVLVALGIVLISPTNAGAAAALVIGGGALSPMAAQLIKTMKAGPPAPTPKPRRSH